MAAVMLNNFTVSTINCNSLNMSNSTNSIQKQKVFGITKLKSDLIFLSDTRLGNRNLTSNVEELKKIFRVNPYCSYNFLYNSTKTKRGTGILIKSNLNFTELERRQDPDENYLAIRATLQGKEVILCSVYGPNNHDPNFFITLFNNLQGFRNIPIIMGGDWNCTYSISEINNNIDCHGMLEPPNLRHSRYMAEFCTDLGLIDPYRGLYPNKNEYSYFPFGEIRKK